MAKRVKLVAPNGGAEIEVNEEDTPHLVQKGWKVAGEEIQHTKKEVKHGKS